MNWQQWFDMGGYGAYVWSSYALTAIILLWNLITPIFRRREVLRKIQNWYRQEDRLS